MSTMLEPAADEQIDIDIRREALESHVLLLYPTIGWWRGMYQLPKRGTTIESGGHVINSDSVTTPRAKLITDQYPLDSSGFAWKKRFQKLESRLAALKDKYSVAFPIAGVRIVPKSRGYRLLQELYGPTLGKLRRDLSQAEEGNDTDLEFELKRQISKVIELDGVQAPADTPVYDYSRGDDEQSIAYDLHVAAREFCKNWPTIREDIARKNDVWDQVKAKVPESSAVMRSKFRLDVVPVELAGGNTSQTLTHSDLLEHHDVVREACRHRVEEAIEEMIAAPRQQLADALAKLREVINRDGRVTHKSFKPVRDAIAKIRMFDFVANSELLDNINQLEHKLDITTPNTLDRVTAASNGFDAAIQGFMQDVESAQQRQRDLEEFGREFRAIDL